VNLSRFCRDGERPVPAFSPELRYTGRIDFDNPAAPVFVFAYTSVEMRFSGTSLRTVIDNSNAFWDNYLGFIIDGVQGKALIPEHNKAVCVTLAESLEDKEHELFFFKRMDCSHQFAFYGFLVGKDAIIAPPSLKAPNRVMEVFGDSVSAGELTEAMDYVGHLDPTHHGQWTNSYYSYAAMTARAMNARLYDTSQGGIALLHGTGWFGPDYLGMEEIWDKIEYVPEFGPSKRWDFSRVTPQVVVVAIGQNDNHPYDIMKDNPNGPEAENWRNHYRAFLCTIRHTYPRALIIAATTILIHDKGWDNSIGKVCGQIGDPKIVHFMYSRNGTATQGHPRVPESEEMAQELCKFLRSFGDGIWDGK